MSGTAELKKIVEEAFSEYLIVNPHHSEDEEGIYGINFFGGNIIVYVSETEVERECRSFCEVGGWYGIIVPCIIHINDPQAVEQNFWDICRDSKDRPLTGLSIPPWKAFIKHTFDEYGKKASAICQYNAKDYIKPGQKIIYPDHIEGVSGTKLGLTLVLLNKPVIKHL